MSKDYEIINNLEHEVDEGHNLHLSIIQLINNFLRYLKEPRYQNPLSIQEISQLFQSFYQDLNSLIIYVYTQSNSTKKQLISNCNLFKHHPLKFDYLLAISNYSSSSIKLVKRTDDEALNQLRIFNYYKFLIILKSMELSSIKLFTAINKDDDNNLFDKLYKFNEKDLIIQQYFDKKIQRLKTLDLKLENFLEKNNLEPFKKLSKFLSGDYPTKETDTNHEFTVYQQSFNELMQNFNQISTTTIPLKKLKIIVNFQKSLINFLPNFLTSEINNDILLPILIYLIIYKADLNLELLLNFNFIKNFVNLWDPYEIYLSNNSNYIPPNDNRLKIKRTTLFECLNLDELDKDIESHDFFNNDKDLINFINSNYLNNSELNYYLTNFEAVLFFIQNVTINELMESDSEEEILTKPISFLVDKQSFKFPNKPDDEDLQLNPNSSSNSNTSNNNGNRSRSGSLFNTITNKISEATKNRSRSNSNVKNTKGESFPLMDESSNNDPINDNTLPIIDNDNFSMMRNILNRFGLVSVQQLKPFDQDEEQGLESTKHIRSQSLVEKLSPNHSRTRSSSFENQSNNPSNNPSTHISPNRKNTIASKLTSGVNEIMTKFNTPVTTLPATTPLNGGTTNHSYNNSTTSLKSLDEPDSATTITKRPEYTRSRTSSMQVMEKWFNNLSQQSQSQMAPNIVKSIPAKPEPSDSIDESQEGSVFSTPSKELMKYHNVEFDELTISDLRNLKSYYDQLCNELGMKFESKSTDLNDQLSTMNSI